MAVSGSKKENKDFGKETGLFEAKVIAINPDKDKLAKMLSVEIEDEITYASQDDHGVKKATVVFWLQDVKTEKLKSLRFYLKDVDRTNKDDTKRQYINNVGITSWSDEEKNLPEWFKARSYRVAKEGEEHLYKFIIDWLDGLNLRLPDAELSFDWRKLISGNVKDLTSQINGDFDRTVILLSTVRVVDKDGEKKEYEQIYNQASLPGYVMKYIKTSKIDKTFIDSAKTLDRKKRSRLQNFVLEVSDTQYGVKDFYTLGELEPYDPAKNIAASDKVINDDDTGY